MGAVPEPMVRAFARRVDSLAAIFDFVSDFALRSGLGPDWIMDIQLVVEEIFTNMVKYDRGGTRDIEVRLRKAGDRAEVAVTDFGVEAFDVTRSPDPQVDRPFAERRPGGLGLHLVRRLSATVGYEYRDGNSTVIVTIQR